MVRRLRHSGLQALQVVCKDTSGARLLSHTDSKNEMCLRP